MDDPELHENIRICYPYGNYEYDNIIYVEKKINILGAVVTYAQRVMILNDIVYSGQVLVNLSR
ncbi:hypothetical protein BANRA_01174 [Escherichia coli]|nr:hypothetical protein BANRA_01174 [Escherichia coli]